MCRVVVCVVSSLPLSQLSAPHLVHLVIESDSVTVSQHHITIDSDGRRHIHSLSCCSLCVLCCVCCVHVIAVVRLFGFVLPTKLISREAAGGRFKAWWSERWCKGNRSLRRQESRSGVCCTGKIISAHSNWAYLVQWRVRHSWRRKFLLIYISFRRR